MIASNKTLHSSNLIRVLGVAALCLLTVAPILAQMPATIRGTITNENGEPVPDVTITITDTERPDFEQIVTSDKKGRYRIHLANAIVPYTYKISKPGYQTLTRPGVNVPARKETRIDLTLRTEQAALVEAAKIDPQQVAKGAAIGIYNQGVLALQAGDIDAAEEFFLAALEKKDDFGSAHGALARVYSEQGEYHKALDHALLAIEQEVDVSTLDQVLYEAYSALGEDAKAQEALKRLQSLDPKKAGKNLFNQAADAYNNGDMAAARAGFERVLTVDPDNARANFLLGMVNINEGKNAPAKELLTRFIELAPDDPDAGLAKDMLGFLD